MQTNVVPMDIDVLKEYIIDTKNVAKIIDEDDISFCYDIAPLTFDWKSEGFRIEFILLNDIFNWLCFMGLGDGIIVDEEVEFINYCLDLNFSQEEIRKLALSKLNKDFKSHLPLSFILFCEAEIVYKDLLINTNDPVHSENLFKLFGVLGESFISCDGEITTDEKNLYEEQIYLLWDKLIDFKERRGITPTYDKLVGENVSKEDIIVGSDLNEKIIIK